MLHLPDDVLQQLLRLALENWYYIVTALVMIFGDKRGTLGKLIQAAAQTSARKRVETGEHKAVNGNSTALRLAATNIESLVDDVRDIRRDLEHLRGETDGKLKQQAAYMHEQIEQVRSEFDARIGGDLAEIKAMLEGMKS